MSALRLYHFTCADAAPLIRADGWVRPNYHPLLDLRLVWFTDDPRPERDDVGLTSSTLTCDRMHSRFRVVDPTRCKRWIDSPYRSPVPADVLRDLETFGSPETWWIADCPVMVL